MIDLPDNDRANGEPLFRWREALGALSRRRRLLAVIVVGGTLTAIAVALLRGPDYEVSAKLAVVSERAHIVLSPDPRAGASVDRLNEQDLHTEVALLNSRTLIREVLAEQPTQSSAEEAKSGWERLWETVRFAPGDLYRRLHGVETPNALDIAVRDVRERLNIAPIKGSNLIEITFRDDDPVAAAAFVNELAANHVDRRVRYNQRSRTRDFFERQRVLLSEKQQRAEEALQSFYEREGIDVTQGEAPALQERMSKLQTALADARRELKEYTARSEYLEEELRNLPRAVAAGPGTSPSAQRIRSHLVDLSLKRSAMLSKYAPTSSRIREIDRQIASAKRLLENEKRAGGDLSVNPAHSTLEVELARVQARLVGLKARVPALEAQIQEYEPLLERLEQIGPEQERLAGEVSAAKEALQTYRRKEEEARFADALDESRIVNVAIVEPATVPHTPEFDGRLQVVLVGTVFSLLLGIVAALVRDRFDPTVKSEEELYDATGLPVLARISN